MMRWFHWTIVVIWTAIFAGAAAIAQIGPTPPLSQFTGNAFAGRCSLNGDAVILPSANWSCSRDAGQTGRYRVTVPAGYDANDYAIVVSISGNWEAVIQAYSPAQAYFLVTIFDRATGAATDASFGFVVTRNATIYP